MEPFHRLNVFLLVLFPVPGMPPPLSVIDTVQSKRKKILKGDTSTGCVAWDKSLTLSGHQFRSMNWTKETGPADR